MRRSWVRFCLAATLLLASPPALAAPDPIAPREPFTADPLSNAAPSGAARVVPPGDPLPPTYAADTNWAEIIDQAWGPSPMSIPQMLDIFDTFWNTIDQDFACFQGLDVDWTALWVRYRTEIQGGVSRGRFAAIMNHLAFALRESHTNVTDSGVNYSALDPGVPLFVVGGWGNNAHFGAGLTPLPDSSLLVYKAIEGHPLGLVPGDIVLGYQGIPWKRLYPQLLAAELPLTGWWWGSSSSSWTHSMLMSAGLNWHLFDTIDVVRHATGDTVHLSVAPLITLNIYPIALDCTEQLPISGVPMPDYLGTGDMVSWGLVSSTQVGYVYVRAWTGNAGTEFYNAVDSLLTYHQTTGLIFDFRTNYGGNMFLAYPGLDLLFGEDVSTIGFAERCDPSDHFAMCPSPSGPPSSYVIHGTAAADYDRPIAVLVGPGAISSGDQVANLFRYHPEARFFGHSTSTAFNAPVSLSFTLPQWYGRYAAYDAYRLSDPDDYLTHDEFPVDEPVWLTPAGTAHGTDAVVDAALNWMIGATGVEGGAPRALVLHAATPNPFRRTTALRFDLPAPTRVRLEMFDVMGRRVRTLMQAASLPAGTHVATWDGRDEGGSALQPGVYLCRLEAGGTAVTTRIAYLR
jgi:hypothetical protein